MSEQVADRTELPPFSFKKKPIEQYCFQPGHSYISDILPSRHHESVSSDHSPNSTIGSSHGGIGEESISREIDYDQQIRAPRMSSTTFFTYRTEKDKRGVSVSGMSNKSKTGSSTSSSSGNDKIAELFRDDKSTDNLIKGSKYLPANFDLTQPTRRLSEPPNPEPEQASRKALLNYTNDNYIYEKEDDEHQKLLKALDNLNSNKTTEEREEGHVKQQPSSIFQTKPRTEIKGGDIKQVYGQKKPLGKPAVLRPIVSTSEEPNNSLAPSVSIFSTPNTSPTASVDGSSSPTVMEPTRVHWKPNSSTNHCMKCFENFSIFSSIKKRRHHCRHCGGIFCSTCLMDNENDKVLLDTDARFIVPIFKNLVAEDYQDIFINFKNFKVCKPCGETYFNLVTDINSKNLKIPYVFIENAYVKKSIQQQKVIAESESSNTGDFKENINDNTIMVDSHNRKSSINNVPSDWTWSSF